MLRVLNTHIHSKTIYIISWQIMLSFTLSCWTNNSFLRSFNFIIHYGKDKWLKHNCYILANIKNIVFQINIMVDLMKIINNNE